MNTQGQPLPPEAPRVLGHFSLLSVLGEGGMGRVYLAEQSNPSRQVALKVLRSATVPTEYQQRFRREVELLAALEHPGIARLYESGVVDTPAGPAPYLAMEYVRGSDLIRHARADSLSLMEKGQLLVSICRAVHHAHTRGVIHRDLKPANILVNEFSQPKMLDFGIAHVLGRDDLTQMTVAGEVLGTIPYMSREQLAGESKSVDPRWDVYALGVIAYELFCGELPYEGLSKQSSVLKALELVQTSTPVPLSKKLKDAKGDLEIIVHKAMAPEMHQRYSSAAELAADLERWLTQRPIEARAPTIRYVTGRFMRRHKALTAGVGIATAGLIAATAISINYGLREARALKESESRAAELSAVNGFMQQMLTSADPYQMRGPKLTVREMLDGARASLDGDKALPLPAKATLTATLAGVYGNIGEFATGLEVLQKKDPALERLPEDSLPRLKLHFQRAVALKNIGEIDGARAELAQVLRLPRSTGALQELRVDALILQMIMSAEDGQAEQSLQQINALAPEIAKTLGPDHVKLFEVEQARLSVYFMLRRFEEARAAGAALIPRMSQALGAGHPIKLITQRDYSMILEQTGDVLGGEQVLRSAIVDAERIYGPKHPTTLSFRKTLGGNLWMQKRYEESYGILTETISAMREVLGETDSSALDAMNNLALVLEDMGRVEDAASMYKQIIGIYQKHQIADTADVLTKYNNLAYLYLNQKKYAEAEALWAEVVQRASKSIGETHPDYWEYVGNWGLAEKKLERFDAARAHYETAFAKLSAMAGVESITAQNLAKRLKILYTERGLKSEAEGIATKILPDPA